METSLQAPLLDLDIVRELMAVTADSGSTYMVHLFQIFATDAASALERMRQCAERGDPVSLAREAHRLKGSSGTVGAIQLAAECFAIERTARGGSCADTGTRINRAFTLLDATRGAVAQFFRGTIAKAA